MKVRLKDIAEAAKVSVMTVSKVMSDASDISDATKARVRKLATEMGYVPDISAQGLRNRKTKLFGVVISAATNPIYARVVMALEDRAHQMGYDVLFAHSLGDSNREAIAVRRFLARGVDGLFISPVYRLETEAPIYDEIEREETPTVILGTPAPFCERFFGVHTNDLEAARDLTRRLVEFGHRRIIFLSGPQAAPWALQRLEGYRAALRDAGLDWDDRLVFQAGSTIEEGRRAADKILAEKPGATAVQAVNDLVAIGTANGLLDAGIKIPDQVSLVGFGNILTAEHFRVPLTTVRQPKWRLGNVAMDLMERLLAGEPAGNEFVSGEYLPRQSIGAVSDGEPVI